jgi:alpha-L-glutamate ligase-like protein
VIARLQRVRRDFLGLNRRNHRYLARTDGGALRLVDDKLATKRHLEGHGIPTTRLLATCDRHGAIAPLVARLAESGAFVVKPARGARGAGVWLLRGGGAAGFRAPVGGRVSAGRVALHLADVVTGAFSRGRQPDTGLVEEMVRPHATLRRWSPYGVADCRILVFRGVPLLAMMRLGTRRSRGRGNLHAGAVGMGIDLVGGHGVHAERAGQFLTVHPDTGVPLLGRSMPAWRESLMLAARAAATVPLDLLGVDVLVDRRRGPLVVELNARPGLTIQIANRVGLAPLLERSAAGPVPPDPSERVALGQRLYSSPSSPYS